MPRTIQQALTYIHALASVPESTVDGLIRGDAHQPLTGIAVCFAPTTAVIRKANEAGCNLLVTHQQLFHHRPDDDAGSHKNQVHRFKEELLQETAIAVYRFHDGPHQMNPELLTDSLIRNVGWNSLITGVNRFYSSVTFTEHCSVQDIIAHLKHTLRISHVRLSGDSDALCKKIGVSAGFSGYAQRVISLFTDENVDVVITGEPLESGAAEFVQDANALGKQYALIVLDHGESEIPGMIKTAKMLTQSFPEVPVHFIRNELAFEVK
ncbi:hypothetical protein BBEV_2463 [Salisediminibacterium beveridgei]|uniref:GTP cyclohydrolase 1 type 2 homolog n=1 Tax=Salisediminibacterium beveridgei TaxID=632773 RepID=A0A1D7QXR7_9BACI|nr:hypothetical protein BBEV_2463 [Salisediminibacterium beveridgei]